jgi:hypothetical protein
VAYVTRVTLRLSSKPFQSVNFSAIRKIFLKSHKRNKLTYKPGDLFQYSRDFWQPDNWSEHIVVGNYVISVKGIKNKIYDFKTLKSSCPKPDILLTILCRVDLLINHTSCKTSAFLRALNGAIKIGT